MYSIGVLLGVLVVGGYDGLLEMNASRLTHHALLEMNDMNVSGLTNVLPIDGQGMYYQAARECPRAFCVKVVSI